MRFVALILLLTSCSHSALERPNRVSLSARAFSCQGTASDENGVATPIRLLVNTDQRWLSVDGGEPLPISTARFHGIGAANQELTIASEGSRASLAPDASWQERIRAYGMSLRLRDADPAQDGREPSGFVVGERDLHWGGLISCPHWRDGIPSRNYGN
jgi:hypothetical protein